MKLLFISPMCIRLNLLKPSSHGYLWLDIHCSVDQADSIDERGDESCKDDLRRDKGKRKAGNVHEGH